MKRLCPALIFALSMLLLGAATASAQRNQVHFRYSIDMPPGTIGRQQLTRGGPLAGYYQPVEVRAPRGARVALHVDGQFERPAASVTIAGMLIGYAYRIKVTGIRGHEGLEVYPTVEVIDRLYPPAGLESQFPIPIELTQEELEMALGGRFVTRVIYLEDPITALPIREDPRRQRYFDVHPSVDPLHTADRLGRPMAILRMGSRVPDADGASALFVYGSPPLLKYDRPSEPIEAVPPNQPPPDSSQNRSPAAGVAHLPRGAPFPLGRLFRPTGTQRDSYGVIR